MKKIKIFLVFLAAAALIGLFGLGIGYLSAQPKIVYVANKIVASDPIIFLRVICLIAGAGMISAVAFFLPLKKEGAIFFFTIISSLIFSSTFVAASFLAAQKPFFTFRFWLYESATAIIALFLTVALFGAFIYPYWAKRKNPRLL